MHVFALQAAFFASLLLGPARQSGASAAVERPLFERVAVLGASLSAGYGLRGELEARADLGTVLECALRAEPDSFVRAADLWFFTRTRGLGRSFVDQVAAADPSIVFALDFLFWFPFGPETSEEERLRELEHGLALLDEIPATLVVADLPDVRAALEGVGPLGVPLVTPQLLPQPQTLARANDRLRAWAAERPRVVLVPLADFAARLRADEELRVGDNRWPAGSLALLIQPDLLHPTLEGAIALALLSLESLRASGRTLPEATDLDARSVRERILERTRAERERARERNRRREERRRSRAEAGER